MNFPQFEHLLTTYYSFIITCHETPDGDAIGSEIALYHALKSLGKKVRIINADSVPEKYANLYEPGTVEIIDQLEDFDSRDSVLIILDTNDFHNIGSVAKKILPKTDSYFIIDHHESGEDIATGKVIEVDSSSTCEILFKIFTDFEIPVTPVMAKALYTG